MESLPAISASDSELQVVFYVSGYCANHAAKRISCGAFLSLILFETKLPSIDVLSDFLTLSIVVDSKSLAGMSFSYVVLLMKFFVELTH